MVLTCPADPPTQAGSNVRVEVRYILKMELLILRTLDWRVSNPTALCFLAGIVRRVSWPDAEVRRAVRGSALELLSRAIPGMRYPRPAAPCCLPRPYRLPSTSSWCLARRAILPAARAVSGGCCCCSARFTWGVLGR